MFLETRKGAPTMRAGTPDGGHLEGPATFAKPFFTGNPANFPRKNNGRHPPGYRPPYFFRQQSYCWAAKRVAASTFTPGPIVDEMATRLM